MRYSRKSRSCRLRSCSGRACTFVLLSLAGSPLFSHAQFSAQVPAFQGDFRTASQPSDPFISKPPEIDFSSSQRTGNPPQWKQTFQDPFQPSIDLGNLNPLISSSTQRYGGSAALGLSPRSSVSFSPFITADRDGIGVVSTSLFSAELPGHPAAGRRTPFDAPTRTLPSLSELLHGNSKARVASPFELQRPTQMLFRPGGGFNDSVQLPAASMFITSDLGNGMLFSAGTGGSHSLIGAPAAGLSSSIGPKREKAAVNLKLSF